MIFSRAKKKSMCPHLPPTFDGFSYKYQSNPQAISKNWNAFFCLRGEIAISNFGPSNCCVFKIRVKRLIFFPLSEYFGIKNFKKGQILHFGAFRGPKMVNFGPKFGFPRLKFKYELSVNLFRLNKSYRF